VFEKQPAQALSRVQAQIAKSPQNSEMYDLLAELQMTTGDPKGALASAEKAMQINPADAGAVVDYTRAEISVGDPAKAVAKWQQWTKDHPADVRGFTLLGSLQESQGDRTGAMDSYKKALAMQPEQPVAANNLAYLMVDTGQNLDVSPLPGSGRPPWRTQLTQHRRHAGLDLLPEGELRLCARLARGSHQACPQRCCHSLSSGHDVR